MKLKLQIVLQVVTLATGLAIGWGSLRANAESLQNEINRINQYGSVALSTHQQIEQDRYTDVMRKLDVIAVEIKYQSQLLEELKDGVRRKQEE